MSEQITHPHAVMHDSSGQPQEISATLKQWSSSFDVQLHAVMSSDSGAPERLLEAMKYSLLAGGKRMRPFLLTRCCQICGGDETDALPAAVAIECIHTFSLIHDDLPAMDDDDLRRGQPTSHKKFDEATAILAGDGLLTLAFEMMTRCPVEPPRIVSAVAELARGTGWTGMIGGQMADITGQDAETSQKLAAYIHERKTAALFESACRIGAILAGAETSVLQTIGGFGRHLGHAFQIADDLLDVTSTSEQLGKGVGKDAGAGKQTYPLAFGVEQSRQAAADAVDQANDALKRFGNEADDLRALATYVIQRHH